MSNEQMSKKEYAKYASYFNPDLYNPKEWAKLAKDAGMKYVVFTAKHHDGFSMYDTQYSDYKVTNAPIGRDLLKELIQKKHYKKDRSIKYLIFDFIEFYLNKINLNISFKFFNEYTYFLKRMSDTKRFNLDEESLFIEFEDKILNG